MARKALLERGWAALPGSWEGLCPTASGRWPPCPSHRHTMQLERIGVATLCSAAEGSLLWRERSEAQVRR